MENVEIVELSSDQQNTIKLSFSAECFKDELSLKKQISEDYDFDFDEEV